MPKFFKIEFGGDPPFYSKGDRWVRWMQIQRSFRELEIPEGKNFSPWMQIHGLSDRKDALSVQQAIGNETRNNNPHRDWGYETHTIQEQDETFTLWVRKGRPLLEYGMSKRPRKNGHKPGAKAKQELTRSENIVAKV